MALKLRYCLQASIIQLIICAMIDAAPFMGARTRPFMPSFARSPWLYAPPTVVINNAPPAIAVTYAAVEIDAATHAATQNAAVNNAAAAVVASTSAAPAQAAALNIATANNAAMEMATASNAAIANAAARNAASLATTENAAELIAATEIDTMANIAVMNEVPAMTVVTNPFNAINAASRFAPSLLNTARLRASNGGGFNIISMSPMGSTGLSFLSDNRINGDLRVNGKIPFLGSVGLEGYVPTEGFGNVGYNCGTGEIVIMNEDYFC